MDYFFSHSFLYAKAALFIVLLGFIPGWLICHGLRITENCTPKNRIQTVLIWSHALSVLIFSLSLWLHAQIRSPLSTHLPLMIAGFSVILALILWRLGLLNRNKNVPAIPFPATLLKTQLLKSLKSKFLPTGMIFLAVLAYLSFVGMYDLVLSLIHI